MTCYAQELTIRQQEATWWIASQWHSKMSPSSGQCQWLDLHLHAARHGTSIHLLLLPNSYPSALLIFVNLADWHQITQEGEQIGGFNISSAGIARKQHVSVKKSANRIQYMVPCKNQSCPVKQIILEDKTDFYRVLYIKWSVTGCGGSDKSCVPCIFLYRVVLAYAVAML